MIINNSDDVDDYGTYTVQVSRYVSCITDVSAVAVKNAQARWTLLVSKEISKARLGMH